MIEPRALGNLPPWMGPIDEYNYDFLAGADPWSPFATDQYQGIHSAKGFLIRFVGTSNYKFRLPGKAANWKEAPGSTFSIALDKFEGLNDEGYGLIAELIKEDISLSGFSYRISQSGYVMLEAFSNGIWTRVIDWIYDPRVLRNQVNELSVTFAQDVLIFGINGSMFCHLQRSRFTTEPFNSLELLICGPQTVRCERMALVRTPLPLATVPVSGLENFGISERIADLETQIEDLVRTVEKLQARPTDSTSPTVTERADSPPNLPSQAASADLIPRSVRSRREDAMDEALRELDQLIGMEEVKQEFRRLVSYLRVQKRRKSMGAEDQKVYLHMVFEGPPGTGKTTVAKMVGSVLKGMGYLKIGHVVEAPGRALVAEWVGRTSPKVNETVKKALGGVLFIDEAYALAKPDATGVDFGGEAVEALISLLSDHRDEMVVVLAGYRSRMEAFLDTNEGLRSRIRSTFVFDHYEPPVLFEIFKSVAEKSNIMMDAAVADSVLFFLEEAYETRDDKFGNGRFVEMFFHTCLMVQANRLDQLPSYSDADMMRLTVEDIEAGGKETLAALFKSRG